mgnify:CR=1 FL=1
MSSAPSIPSKIGRYEVEGLAAEGAMGAVYVARDPRMKRKVAVKVLKVRASRSSDARRRFESEAEAIAAVEHPAIVPIYDFGEFDDQPFIVMRYLPGGTLEDRLEPGPLSLRDTAPVFERIAAGLDTVHAKGIVHRDVKPANILFDAAGDAYLSDFGIVKVDTEVDNTGFMLLGTPKYMSPEQAQSRSLDARSDVYSLAAVAFHALTGRGPFEAESPLAMAMAHVSKTPTSIRTLRDDLPQIADAVFHRALAKQPQARHPSAGAFARDLRDLAAGRWYLIKVSDAFEAREAVPKPAEGPGRVQVLPTAASESVSARAVTETVDVDVRVYTPDDTVFDEDKR